MKHILWKVSNGYLRVPDEAQSVLTADQADKCSIFKTLEEFAKWKPKRTRNRKPKLKSPKPGQTESET